MNQDSHIIKLGFLRTNSGLAHPWSQLKKLLPATDWGGEATLSTYLPPSSPLLPALDGEETEEKRKSGGEDSAEPEHWRVGGAVWHITG